MSRGAIDRLGAAGSIAVLGQRRFVMGATRVDGRILRPSHQGHPDP